MLMKRNNNSEAITIASAIHDWLEIYLPQIHSNSIHTRKAYSDTLTLFVDFLEKEKSITHANLSANCFSIMTIQDWLLWLKNKRNCSSSTCNHRLACLRSFLKYLSHKDIRFVEQENKSLEIKRMKAPKKGIQEITRAAMKAFFSAPDLASNIGKRDFALFTLMYNTATRINEILSLRICDVYLDMEKGKNYIIVWGKGAKRRTIYLLPEVVKIIKSYVHRFHGTNAKEEDFVFFSPYGHDKRKLTQEAVNKRLKLYARIAHSKCPEMPENLHCHNLRSARATHWLEEGLNIVMIQKLLGHENLTTTMGYVAVSNAQKAKALETLEDDVARNTSKKWKKVKKTSSLAEILGLR